MQATIEPFFDPTTSTYTYVVSDPATGQAAIIDSVLDYDPASGRLSTESADRLIAYVQAHDLNVQWILETHVHADHLTAAAYLKDRLGGQTGIGRNVAAVQKVFGALFNAGAEFAMDGSQFDWNNPAHAAAPFDDRDPRFYATVLYDGAGWKPRPDDVAERQRANCVVNIRGNRVRHQYRQSNGVPHSH